MTITMLEIGLEEFYKEIDADKINKNYNNFYWRQTKAKIVNLIKQKVGIHKNRPKIFGLFFRWLRRFVIKKPPIEYCLDFTCLIDVSIMYEP